MNGANGMVIETQKLQEIIHVVSQIEKLRESIINKLQNKRYPEQQILDVLADAMDAVDETTRIHPQKDGWARIYTEMKQGRITEEVCSRISEWQKETLNWVDHMESRRLIQVLQEEVQKQAEFIQKLMGNNNVRKGWYPEINRERINYALEMDHSLGITVHKRERQIIVSLTSYPDRMYELKYTLYSLLHQTLKPDRIILWLAEEQFPEREADIAPSLLALKENGISIMWCEDIKSYKKLIPALERFPEDIIVTADDDLYYPENWLELLYNSYLENPDCVHCHRAHRVQILGGQFAPYNSWPKKVSSDHPVYQVFPTNGGGTLFPPHKLYKDVVCKELFTEIAPGADDIWFWAMCLLNQTKIQIVTGGIKQPVAVNWSREIGITDESTLYQNNGAKQQNDIYLGNILRKYPELLEILQKENSVQTGWESSAKYWEQRYLRGGTSGAGSYRRLAEFKAKIVNQLVHEEKIARVIEWGCGDGNQLMLADYPEYVGYDVSKEAVGKCQELFRGDNSKQFLWSGAADFVSEMTGDLALSLDVLYHLVEDDIFELYMQRLFESSTKYVCIYSCNFDRYSAAHVRCRKFTDYIDRHMPDWRLVKKINNEYPYDEKDPLNTSWSDFYIYKKVNG